MALLEVEVLVRLECLLTEHFPGELRDWIEDWPAYDQKSKFEKGQILLNAALILIYIKRGLIHTNGRDWRRMSDEFMVTAQTPRFQRMKRYLCNLVLRGIDHIDDR